MAHHHHHDQVYNTNHYVWSSRDRLGYGATGAVYLGYNKVTLSACLSNYVLMCPPPPHICIVLDLIHDLMKLNILSSLC